MVYPLQTQVLQGYPAWAPIWNSHRRTLEICACQRRDLADTLQEVVEAREELLQQAACGVIRTPATNPAA